jgi:hypothetical protein
MDFINSFNLIEELKNNEIYDLFKTDSSDFNMKFLSNINQFKTTHQFIKNYTKVDVYNIFNVLNNVSLNASKIINSNNSALDSEIEVYALGVSKIILLLGLIQKNNQLLNNLLNNTKLFIKTFYSSNKKESNLKEKYDLIINDLISSTLIQRSYSRRSTNEVTNSSICINFENKNYLIKNNLGNKQDYLFRSPTPKFEEEENAYPSINYNHNQDLNEIINKRNSSKNMDSSLTLDKLNFVQQDEEEKKDKKLIKSSIKSNEEIFSSISKGYNRKKNKSLSTKVKVKAVCNKNRKNSVNSVNDKYKQNERIKILAEFFDSINFLFKEGKISSEQKIIMKQIIISNPKIVIDKFYQAYKNLNNESDNILINKNIQLFLIEEFKGVNVYKNVKI